MNRPDIEVLFSDWKEYELLDSGDRLKLERFGDCVAIRGEPKAWWGKSNPSIWKEADCRYFDEDKKNSRWEFFKRGGLERLRPLNFNGIKFRLKFMEGSKHLGVFPEQSPHWNFIMNSMPAFRAEAPRLLNLFGYTGAATLAASKAGYAVTHVDASKPSVDWARKNAFESGMSENRIRWIVDDALKFVERENRRGARYDAIILDPPAFGRGPKGELWKLEKTLSRLLETCSKILSDNPIFVLMTLYSIEASPIMAGNMLEFFLPPEGKTRIGELALNPKYGNANLPLSIWALWSAGKNSP